MAKFKIKAQCEATVTEYWEVEADSIDDAKAALEGRDVTGAKLTLLCESVDEEHDREILEVEAMEEA